MKKTRAISLLLSLSLICAMLVPGAAAFAENETDSGMVISKTATANNDGSYTITLEAYATGEKVISEVTEDVPTDIVLVLDQSGSMAETMSTYGFRKYTSRSNSYLYNRRHNGGNNNLYYQLDDGSYATVSVSRTRYTYAPCPSDWQNDESASMSDWYPDDYWKYSDNLFVKDKVGEYQKVTVTYQYDRSIGDYVYTYTFPNGNTVTSNGDSGQPGLNNFDGNGPVYYATTTSEYTYTYTYTDKDGVTHTIGTSTGADTQPTEFTLYERYQTGSKTRLEALKDAVTNFADAVAKKAAGADKTLGTDDDVNHRIAVVGFSSDDYSNTELLTGVKITTGKQNYGTQPVADDWYGYYYYPTGYAKNGAQYGSITDDQYSKALQNMDTAAGKANVTDAFNALTAHGGTYTNDGMDMANEIFRNAPIDAGKKRNRVVIVFTDGVPGLSGYDSGIAANAISKGNTAKNTHGASVYTVGIFSGADATSAGNQNGNETQKANWFMQNLSSNNGKVQTPSYYLSAADADTLNSIFQQISDQIETGGSSTTLSSETVIKDIIAPAFTLPANATVANITLETYQCTGKNGDAYTWTKNETAMGATATIGSTDTADATTTNNQVSVTGFDFAENWVGTETSAEGTTTYRGNKLVIKFNVTPRPGFLGGNNVITNTSAGVYENANAENPVLTFEQPTADVEIGKLEVSNVETNVYLGGYYSVTVPAEQIKAQMTATCGGVTLDLTQENFGLKDWQHKYVDIVVTVKDADGNDLTGGIESLTKDVAYTVTITVTPKETEGSATAQTGSGTDTIHVFKPELTFADSEVYYGDTAPTAFDDNLAGTRWVHYDSNGSVDKVADAEGVTMLNAAPTLALTYTPDSTKIKDGKINTKQDIAVDVTVKIGNTDVTADTTFQHTNCTGKNCTVPADKEFLLHVKTCQLTITKTGGAANEPYVFTVNKDGAKYTEVTIVGNGSATIYELPVDTYTIAEDTGWSWRYNADNGNGVTLSKDYTSGTITCTNSANNKIYWLNGFSQVVANIFGTANTANN